MLRRILPYTTVLTFLALIYTGWTLYSRHQAAADVERELQQKKTEANQRLVDSFGGEQLTILAFNAAEREVSSGGRVLLCYGVSNAAKVRIEPGVEPIQPALTRCLEVFPKKTTTYTLTAEDAKGSTKTASLTVAVR